MQKNHTPSAVLQEVRHMVRELAIIDLEAAETKLETLVHRHGNSAVAAAVRVVSAEARHQTMSHLSPSAST